jgi:hypothetical protein
MWWQQNEEDGRGKKPGRWNEAAARYLNICLVEELLSMHGMLGFALAGVLELPTRR